MVENILVDNWLGKNYMILMYLSPTLKKKKKCGVCQVDPTFGLQSLFTLASSGRNFV